MIVFVCGLHRSGTTLLARALADHPDASGFSDTGFPEDEGQFLQSVYPIAHTFGGPGRFGFDARSHLTERSSLATEENRDRLFSEWGRYWNLDKRLLVEKSPPNLLKLRFLQALFPEAVFVVIIRHPVAVSLATRKWIETPVSSLIEHWLVCHELFEGDAVRVRRLIAIRYEDLIAEPTLFDRLQGALGLGAPRKGIDLVPGHNECYFERWQSELEAGPDLLAADFDRRARRFGYSLVEPEREVTPAPEIDELLDAWW